MAQKIKTFFVRYRWLLFFALLGVIAGILPSVLNHFGEFWKWGFLAKTATQYGFWVIIITLIILKSETRKLAVLNTFLFCFIMVIVYGITETLYKIPLIESGFVHDAGFFDLFLEYERTQIHWFIVIILLVPISILIYDYTHRKGNLFTKLLTNLLIVIPLVVATVAIFSRLSTPVVVCADLSRNWQADICTFQHPDVWIVSNLVVEGVLYIAFIVFWVTYSYRLQKSKKLTK